MLTQLELFTPGVYAPPLPIVDQDVSKDPFQIKKIDGLGPVTANVNTTQYGSIDGEFLNGTNTPKRNIVITMGLNPDWSSQTFESLRQILYSYFMTENEVTLRFTSTHMETVEIVGYVESCEPDLYSKDPEYQISIICPRPFFTAIQAFSLQGVTQNFTNPADITVDYQGSADVGFTVDVTLPSGGAAYSGEFRMLNKTPSTKLFIASVVAVNTSKYLEMSTVQGDKYLRQYPLPSGQYTNILNQVTPGSSWPILRKGPNKLQILTTTMGLNWTLSYYARYGGL